VGHHVFKNIMAFDEFELAEQRLAEMEANEDIGSIFHNEGDLLEVQGQQSILLNIETYAWLVAAGAVDLFSAPLEQGTPVGARSHLLRLNPGQIFFGIAAAPDHQERGLMAVGGIDTTVWQLPLSRIQQVAKEYEFSAIGVSSLCDEWIAALLRSFKIELIPQNCQNLQPSGTIRFEPQTTYKAYRGVNWVRHIEGGSCLMGKDDLPTIADGYFPISEKTWLQANSPVVIEAVTTLDLIAQDDFWTYLQQFQRFILASITITEHQAAATERQRLRQKAQDESLSLANAFLNLATVITPEKADRIVATADPLLSACQTLGKYLNLVVVAPPDSEGNCTLEGIARASRIKVRPVLLRGTWWRHDHGPLIAYQGPEKRPVALLPASPTKYLLVDAVTGARQHITAKVAETLEGVAYMAYRPFPERLLSGMDLVRMSIAGMQNDLSMIALMGIGGALIGMLTPVVTGILFDKVIPASDRTQLLQIGALLLVCATADAVFGAIKAIAMLRVEGKADAGLQAAVWDRLLALPATFFRGYTAGDLALRSTGISTIRQMLSGATVQSLLAGLFSVGYLALLFYYDKGLAGLATLISVVNVAMVMGLSYLYVCYQRPLNEIEGKVSGLILQLFTGISKLRVTGTEDRAFGLWSKHFGEQRKLAFKAGMVQNIQHTLNSIIPVVASSIIFYAVLPKLMTPDPKAPAAALTTGQFLAFLAAYGTFQTTLLQMSSALMSVLQIVPLYNRLQPILQTTPEVDDAKAKPTRLTGDIEVSHVNFKYQADGPLILKDVCMQINSGEFVALVGGSGSGKSTLMRLLLGFETPENGAIYYDRQDLATIDVTAVRRQMGVVLQNSQIMAGSIFHNIAGASHLTLKDAWEAARMAGCEADIREMAMGMHTMLPQGGGSLSGGQRQRIMIARAIIKKPRILFFDEATSALDNHTQAIVSASIEKLQATRIVIAHRLSTIINADRIYVLDQGQIVQSGTYEELMKQKGLFAELAKRQMA
jgi:NHLM bacteriocin system ABC transporter ATP-binding protein